ncbi:hypothetical protein CAPTEDRAFT_224570 [Capitella teleta]|uniref:Multidrug and toxin extrusion protein n=1 Tax=Capitella teleta TaxID=283909 RepID=R7VGH8_CAPTE|nr:hypothetical protein CAPTEDRAFT_224570 [Capitella teleta]|eukprot:ELU15421.1 hypothetical protein CAPTEDRAFT_224570 [Capitella teleta]
MAASKKGYQSLGGKDDGDEDEPLTITNPSSDGCCPDLREKLYPAGFRSELKEMLSLTWPIVLTQVGQMIIGPISLMFCGHLADPILLDGAAMSISMINATCIGVGQGLGTACDTFFSQSFGSVNKKNVGVNMQRAMYIFLLTLIPCYVIHMNIEPILVALGQDPRIARLTGQYMLIFMPGALSFFMYIILCKFMQNQNIVYPNMVIGLIANLINCLLHYIFLYRMNMGTDGSAIAQMLAYVLLFVLTLVYILVSKCYKEAWGGWTTESLQDWSKFTRLCIPGMLMLCMEWWGFEIGVFLTGVLGTTELGAQSVVLQLDSIWFQIPLGIQIASSIRIGQYLGANKPKHALTSAQLGITLVVIASLIAVVIFLALQYQLPYLFTNVEDVAQLTAQLLPIVALYVFFDGVATACKGVMYGTGRQIYGAVLLFISYYVLALPIGIPLMFLTSLRSAGYWWALALNLILQATVLTIIVYRTDWKTQASNAMARAGLLGELEDEADEETGLIREEFPTMPTPRRRTRSRLVSASLTYNQVVALVEDSQPLSTAELICRRSIVVFIMLVILAVGVVIRRTIVLDDPFAVGPTCLLPGDLSNSTLPFCDSVTTSLPTDFY